LRFNPASSEQQVKIFGLNGALVHRSRVPAMTETWNMDVRLLQKGLYLVQVTNQTGSFSTRVALP
jgi:Secretion system C-terminal sorting domain